jgi:hypothetical protein
MTLSELEQGLAKFRPRVNAGELIQNLKHNRRLGISSQDNVLYEEHDSGLHERMGLNQNRNSVESSNLPYHSQETHYPSRQPPRETGSNSDGEKPSLSAFLSGNDLVPPPPGQRIASWRQNVYNESSRGGVPMRRKRREGQFQIEWRL